MKRPNLGMAPIKTEVSVEAYREIMRLEKTIERLREALREYTCDCENGCQGIRGEVCGNKARTALGEKE